MEHLHEMLAKSVTKDSTNDDIEHIVCEHSDPSAKLGKIPDHDEIKKIFKNDSIQEIMLRLEASNSDFAQNTKKVLAKMSPLSMAVVFELLKRGAKMDVKECFEMEFKVAAGLVDHTEFFEGVRALLVDKDKQPKWHYKTVNQIKSDDVAKFFDRSETLNLDLYKDI
jgi:enoyl-CoA hydratase